jgi:CRP/FNR family cyclic AMP-dependent transcriptional regulator
MITRVKPLLEWRYYGSGFAIFRQNQKAAGAFIIQSGWVALSTFRSGGRRVPIGLRGPGSVLGLGESIDSSNHLTTAETGEETELEFLPSDSLLSLLDLSSEFKTRLVQLVLQQTREIVTELFDAAARVPAGQRLWKTLAELAASSGYQAADADPCLQMTVQDLSTRIGCSRQWTSTLLAELERKGAIHRRDGWIMLRKPSRRTARKKSRR